ncbi:hypothetical protein BJ875DRAFT_525530, partial [Amylocarpus encephaloides]
MFQAPQISVLGRDPAGRTHRINGNSFQQNAITTINGFQYVAYYTEKSRAPTSTCLVNLARRAVNLEIESPSFGIWETIVFEDYEQVVDDGHNTISIGVCRGDGMIHLAFDHHCDELRFRTTHLDDQDGNQWSVSKFSKTQNHVQGLEPSDFTMEVSYPRFVNVGDDLILTYRIGQAGQGSDVLYRYSAVTHEYTFLGQYLTGTTNSPYINGLDHRLEKLHVSWCYRNFVSFPKATSPDAHKQQAGPNGPGNNFDLNYAYSEDQGNTWKSPGGQIMATIETGRVFTEENSIMPETKEMRVFDIPMGSGILNQEAQVADWDGGFWVLNREKINGVEHWILYRRKPSAEWTKVVVKHSSGPTEIGSRAKVCVDRRSNVYLVLPGNFDDSLCILQARKDQEYRSLKPVWIGDGYDGEPLIDVHLLEVSDVLSVFTRTAGATKEVVVLNFLLE